MKLFHALTVLSLCWMPATALQGGGLVKVDRGSAKAGDAVGEGRAAFDGEAWQAELTDPSLERREASYERLLVAAARDPQARAALEDWASDEARPDLAWTARLALRELDRAPRGGRQRSGSAAPPSAGRFFAPRAPGRAFAQPIDPFGDAFGGFDFGAFEDRLHELLSEPSFGLQWAPGDGTTRGESFQLEQGPDGVRVEIGTDVDGRRETRTYEGESLEKLLEANPELRDRIGSVHVDTGSTRDAIDRMLDDLRSGNAVPGHTGKVRTDVLGVMMREAADREESLPGVPDGVGLLVERIVPKTIAEVLGVRRGDVLVDLNGSELRTGADVSRVLGERAPDQAVELTLVDGQGERRTLVWKPAADERF